MKTELDAATIVAAIEGFQSQQTRIASKIAELRGLLSGASTGTNDFGDGSTTRKRKAFSAETKRKMALAQKARWASLKGNSSSESSSKAVPAKAKRKISKAGRAAIIAATKKRWADFRAAKAAA